MALHNPVLESAAQILFAKADRHMHIHFLRSWAANNQGEARAVIERAAREVDFLRAIGVLEGAPPPILQDEDDRLTVHRLFTAHILGGLISSLEAHAHAAPAFYEYHLARGLQMALGELAEGSLIPQTREALDQHLPAIAQTAFRQAAALLVNIETPEQLDA